MWLGRQYPELCVYRKAEGSAHDARRQNWMTFEADEVYSTTPPTFVWRASFPTQFMPVV